METKRIYIDEIEAITVMLELKEILPNEALTELNDIN